MSDWYRWDGPDLLLKLKLQPKSSRDAFAGQQNDRLRVRITAPPVDGRANTHLLAWLAGQAVWGQQSVCHHRDGPEQSIEKSPSQNPGAVTGHYQPPAHLLRHGLRQIARAEMQAKAICAAPAGLYSADTMGLQPPGRPQKGK